jgi:hypothetical protein
MKSSVFWDIIPCSLVKADIAEEVITSIFKKEDARNQLEAGSKQGL